MMDCRSRGGMVPWVGLLCRQERILADRQGGIKNGAENIAER
jgi:hypothetical protein